MKRYGRQTSNTRVAWDEANLSFLEANKTPKRKITEPKTPYHAPEGMISPSPSRGTMDNAEHAQAICNALSEVASSSDQGNSRRGGGWILEEEEDDVDEPANCDYNCTGLGQSGYRLSFAEQRKAHYDEFRMIKSLRQEDMVLNVAEEDVDSTQKGQEQDMLIDGIESVELHDASPSGSCKKNTGKQPRCS